MGATGGTQLGPMEASFDQQTEWRRKPGLDYLLLGLFLNHVLQLFGSPCCPCLQLEGRC